MGTTRLGKRLRTVEELFVPGSIVWIHRIDGHLEAAVVPCDLPSLRRIIIDKRMLTDHTEVAMHQAILAVHARQILESTPGSSCHQKVQWQPFSAASERCPCCSSSYEWLNTS